MLRAGEDPGNETELSAAPEEICVEVTDPESKLGEAAPAPPLTSASSLIKPCSLRNCSCFCRCSSCLSFKDSDLCGGLCKGTIKSKVKVSFRRNAHPYVVNELLTLAAGSGVGVFFSYENTEEALS